MASLLQISILLNFRNGYRPKTIQTRVLLSRAGSCVAYSYIRDVLYSACSVLTTVPRALAAALPAPPLGSFEQLIHSYLGFR
jgi:hypothetical protein